jgi:hypothetical protein
MAYVVTQKARDGETIWQLLSDDIELIAGMVAASIGIFGLSFLPYYLETTADISSIRLLRGVSDFDVAFISCNRIPVGKYGLWVKAETKNCFSLYCFSTSSFYQGFITMCNACGVDFRSYCHGLAFDHDNKLNSLEGYENVRAYRRHMPWTLGYALRTNDSQTWEDAGDDPYYGSDEDTVDVPHVWDAGNVILTVDNVDNGDPDKW